MCGISGFISEKKLNTEIYYKAHSLMGHRGPDDEGFVSISDNSFKMLCGDKTVPARLSYPNIKNLVNCNLVLGHHRLSILDLSEAGHQPFISSCNRYSMVYNGEIFNYSELREELKSEGFTFKSTSDTEVVLNSFVKWGLDSFNKFNGMWAIVLYDKVENRVVFSRDRYGIKPLYYMNSSEGLYFASELKFFKGMSNDLTLNTNVANNYLSNCGLDYNEETFYKEVKAVPASTFGVYDLKEKGLSFRKYWSVEDVSKSRLTYNEALDKLTKIFSSSLNLRMRSDVPVGSLLSGGLDSTAIACILAREYDLGDDGLQTFSAVFKEAQFSEHNYVNDTAKEFKEIRSNFVYPTYGGLKQDLSSLLSVIETPIRSFAAYSQYSLYKYIKQNSNVVVLLNGQGSDEIFAGYKDHFPYLWANFLKSGRLYSLYKEINRYSKYRKDEASTVISGFFKGRIKGILGKDRPAPIMPGMTGVPDFTNQNNRWDLSDKLKFDLSVSALPEYLRYEDRNSMAFSLEARLPFMDYRLVEFAFSLPCDFKIRKGVSKIIMRDAVADKITKSVLNRKDKMGFISPQQKWQAEEMYDWMKEIIYEDDDSGLFNHKELLSSFNEYAKIKDNMPNISWYWWRVFCFKFWYKEIFKKAVF